MIALGQYSGGLVMTFRKIALYLICFVFITYDLATIYFWPNSDLADINYDRANTEVIDFSCRNCLSEAEQVEYHHLSEGSEIFPIRLLRALKKPETSHPFMEDMERFGLRPALVATTASRSASRWPRRNTPPGLKCSASPAALAMSLRSGITAKACGSMGARTCSTCRNFTLTCSLPCNTPRTTPPSDASLDNDCSQPVIPKTGHSPPFLSQSS